MVKSQAAIFVPGVNEPILAMARITVSCTRSSARSAFPLNDIANARKFGMAASMTSCTDGTGVIGSVRLPTAVDRGVFTSAKMIAPLATAPLATYGAKRRCERPSTARSGSDGVRAGKLTSNPPEQHKNDNDDQDDADDTDAAVSVAVTIAAEAAAETAKQENDEDDEEDESERHGLVSSLLHALEPIAAPESEQY